MDINEEMEEQRLKDHVNRENRNRVWWLAFGSLAIGHVFGWEVGIGAFCLAVGIKHDYSPNDFR